MQSNHNKFFGGELDFAFKVTSVFQRMQSNHNNSKQTYLRSQFKVTSVFQRMQSNHNRALNWSRFIFVQSYLSISKNAIKSQLRVASVFKCSSSKLPQYFKECNQITTLKSSDVATFGSKLPQYFKECNQITTERWAFKVTSVLQRMQSNHNSANQTYLRSQVQSYLSISKNAIKSQQL